MKILKKSIVTAIFILGCFAPLKAQESAKINPINNSGMPNRISMNVTVAKQTQGSSFGEKVVAGKINVTLVDDGCVILFSSGEGYRVSATKKSIVELSKDEARIFGEKVNQGLQAAGGARTQRTAIVGGALPGGAIISAAVSSVGNLAGGAGGGAAAASYAKTGNKDFIIKDADANATIELNDGEYELKFVIVKDNLKTQVTIGFTVEKGVLKTKHDTAKNSVGNIR